MRSVSHSKEEESVLSSSGHEANKNGTLAVSKRERENQSLHIDIRQFKHDLFQKDKLIDRMKVEIAELRHRFNASSYKRIDEFENYKIEINARINQSKKLSQLNDKARKLTEEALMRFTAESIKLEKTNEELNESNQNLVRSNEQLEEFAYIASHDLKEPLRGVHNYSSFLMEDYYKLIDEPGREMLESLMDLTQNMEERINALLEYSSAMKKDLQMVTFDIHHTLSQLKNEFQQLFASENLSIQIKGTPSKIVLDKVRITEVIRNLISNGIKYNTSKLKVIEIDFVVAHGRLEIKVTDNGIGIKEAHKDRIFTMFKRLHGRDKYGGGTGIGLSIVKKLIERHGGDIVVNSELNKGTTFHLIIPLGKQS